MTLYCFFAVGLLLSAGGYCRADELRELEQRIEFLERFKERVEDELEQGGRRFPTVSFNSESRGSRFIFARNTAETLENAFTKPP